jgi:hypothetical protein
MLVPRMGTTNLQSKDAVRVRRAARWLRKGQPVRALRQLQRLTKRAWKHPFTERIIWQAANTIL